MTVAREELMEKVVALTKRRKFKLTSPLCGEARIRSRLFICAREGVLEL